MKNKDKVIGVVLVAFLGIALNVNNLNQDIQSDAITGMIVLLFAIIVLSSAFLKIKKDEFNYLKSEIKKFKKYEKELTGDKSNNHAIAIFYSGTETRKYASASGKKLDEQCAWDDYTLCQSVSLVEKKLPVRRLDTNFEWINYDKDKLGFAEKKKFCCERKICAQILKDFNEKKLEGSTLIIYTVYEPCIYCYDALTQMQDKGVKIKLYFAEMIYEKELKQEEIYTKCDEVYKNRSKNN